jgi:protein O-mannosyl-transferase
MKRLKNHFPLLIILMCTALVYTRSLENGILNWDDNQHITENGDIQSLSLHNIQAIFTSSYVSMYHPLVTLSFALEHHFFGLNAAVYHATNVLFHLANVVLVFSVVLLLSRRRTTALMVACLFGLHPMHVESVAWITERKDVVYAFFYLSALLWYLRYLQGGRRMHYWMVGVCFLLSLLSKTTAITLPVVLLLIDFYTGRRVSRQSTLEKLPLFFLSLVFGLIALHSQGGGPQILVASSFHGIDRIFLASYSLCYYLVHVFLPMNLSALHWLPMKVGGLLPIEYYCAPLPLIILLFLGTRKGIFQREYIFGMVFFVIGVSLNLHLVEVGLAVVSERYTYLAYVGLYYIIGQGSVSLYDRYQDLLFPWKRALMLGAALVAIFFGYLTYQRVGVWNNTSVLFQDAVMKAESSKQANNIRTLAYMLEAEEKHGMNHYVEAIDCLNKAIALSPQMPELYDNRGVAYVKMHKYDDAMRDYEKAIELNSSFALVYTNRAILYLKLNRQEEACADVWTAYRLGLHDAFKLVHVNCF